MQLKEINYLKKEIELILADNKALDIKSINLKNKTTIADFMIIASGTSSRHIQALSEILIEKLKSKGFKTVPQIFYPDGEHFGDYEHLEKTYV